ncbi:hypothetical protein SUGI_1510000 [Cryptomeria japonica]|uniref:Uncharacterized protein n=1 Tax=Cryptomeria japonica TaxID=3369 RepID=A0AAD3NV31_CRYJA|nr:hypothetical protein SUGI_1373190 [Cryptomeria japonica]GLJ59475.1 hypothetical protein SUGI_1510000 [Cryptomeria japonica]
MGQSKLFLPPFPIKTKSAELESLESDPEESSPSSGKKSGTPPRYHPISLNISLRGILTPSSRERGQVGLNSITTDRRLDNMGKA